MPNCDMERCDHIRASYRVETPDGPLSMCSACYAAVRTVLNMLQVPVFVVEKLPKDRITWRNIE